jgi:3-oxoacyl-[acyl-carrier-protein] synthase-1
VIPAIRLAGTGIVSCYGSGLAPAVNGLKNGPSHLLPPDDFELPGGMSAKVSLIPRRLFTPGAGEFTALCCQAIDQCLAHAGYSRAVLQDEHCALIVGSGGFLFIAEAEIRKQRVANLPDSATIHAPSWGAHQIMAAYGMRGRQFTLTTACSSSANALLLASEMLSAGLCRRALVVGAEGLCATTLSGFQSLMLLAPNGCRPFDQQRQGLQLGEAVACLLLERVPSPLVTGCYLSGGANRCDTYHPTSAAPAGDIMAGVMQQALAQSGIRADAVDLVKIHGVGSRDSDSAEAAALRQVFGAHMPPLTGLKRYVGHTLGASGALETALLSGCLQQNFMPATAGFTTVDDDLALTPLRHAIPASGVRHVLMNYFGFGGNYTSLVMHHVA